MQNIPRSYSSISANQTVVVQDEYGREIQRIVSARPNANARQLQFQQRPQQQPQYQQQYAQQAPQYRQNYSQFSDDDDDDDLNPNSYDGTQQYATDNTHLQPVVPQQPYIIQSPPQPYVVQQPQYIVSPPPVYVASPSQTHTYIPASRQTERVRSHKPFDLSSKTRVSNSYYNDTKRNVLEQPKPRERYLHCCTFCDRPKSDTCYCCWRVCACPLWWTLILALLVILVVGGIGAVIALVATNTITFG